MKTVHRDQELWAKLSPRQAEILNLYLHNPNVKEIARHSNLAESTVRSHPRTIEEKARTGQQTESAGY